jgi:CMP-N,N'-diacetyllegionaminic acid synthase
MKILALITARGGSKRLPGKNIKVLGSKPLIVWSIESAKGIRDICDVLVSTDDIEIAQVAEKAGAFVPWLRPEELATDTATSVDVCIHALDWYEKKRGKVDGLLLLQPTSPFRTSQTIRRGIELFVSNHKRSVISVSKAASHPWWCFKIKDLQMLPFIEDVKTGVRSQDLPPAFVTNGALYLVAPEKLRKTRSFLNEDNMPLEMLSAEECIDIDTEWDWKIAEMIFNFQKKSA